MMDEQREADFAAIRKAKAISEQAFEIETLVRFYGFSRAAAKRAVAKRAGR